MGTSHHEPMMRAHDEWRRHGEGGAWNYAHERRRAARLLDRGHPAHRRVRERRSRSACAATATSRCPREANIALLERIVADQRRILAREPATRDLPAVPQVWALYKEVQEYYEKGMRVPDDVTLLWCDDNWGNIRRLPTPEERERPGGAGVYYHFDYVGGPRSYKWLNTMPLPEGLGADAPRLPLRRDAAVDRQRRRPQADGGPDPVLPRLRLGPGALAGREPRATTCARGPSASSARSTPPRSPRSSAQYTTLQRPPQARDARAAHLQPGRLSRGRDRRRRLSRARARGPRRVHARCPAEARDAFFQLVLYPVKACAVLNELYVTVGRNRLYAVQGRTSTNDLAERARELFREDEALVARVPRAAGGGKWNHMMDQTHIGYTYWNQPMRNAMPGGPGGPDARAGEMGVAVEGSEASWPGSGPRQPALPGARRLRPQAPLPRGLQPRAAAVRVLGRDDRAVAARRRRTGLGGARAPHPR